MKPHPRNRKPIRKRSLRPGGERQDPERERVLALARRAVEEGGAEVLEARILHPDVLRVVADREDPPVDAGFLVQLIKRVRRALTDADLDPGAFRIEVDSPGERRLLTSERHCRRFAGRDARLTLPGPDGAASVVRLLGWQDGGPWIKEADGTERVLEPGCWSELRLVPEPR